ncbi:MAG TPA: polysaccharide deacetylase family protein [Dongiaceae bacterium]
MSAWRGLEIELELWLRAGRDATLWWRDDDAVTATPELERLLGIARLPDGAPLPLCLAVIPRQADRSLAEFAASQPQLSILQHGFAHTNHAPEGEKKAELGAHRPVAPILGELMEGWDLLRVLFAAMLLPVLVPPWNRIAPAVRSSLPGIGLSYTSTYGPRTRGDRQAVNTHADIIDWHRGRGFVGEDAALALIAGHLAARREGRADPDEPTGLLTHHLVHDEACWNFLTELVYRLSRQAGVRWLAGTAIFGQTASVAPKTVILR